MMDDATVGQSLGRIEATLVSINDKIDVQSKVNTDTNHAIFQLERRIDLMERKHIRLGGCIAGVTFTFGVLGGVALAGFENVLNFLKGY